MIVDPWGMVVAQASDGVRTVMAEIVISIEEEIRQKFPALLHRRHDLFEN